MNLVRKKRKKEYVFLSCRRNSYFGVFCILIGFASGRYEAVQAQNKDTRLGGPAASIVMSL